MVLTPAPQIEGLVHAVGGDVPLGSAHIRAETSEGVFELTIDEAPGLHLFAAHEVAWREAKWCSMVGDDYVEIVNCVQALISQQANDSTWVRINQFLREG